MMACLLVPLFVWCTCLLGTSSGLDAASIGLGAEGGLRHRALATASPALPPTKAMVSAASCRSPVPRARFAPWLEGCKDFVTVGTAAILKVLDEFNEAVIGNPVDNDSEFLSQILRPLLSVTKDAMTKAGYAGADSNLCMGNFKGEEILSAPMTGHNSALYVDKCPKIPVAPGGEYLVFSMSLPQAALAAACPVIAGKAKPGAMVSACFVLSVCDSRFPTLGVAMNGQMQSCFLGNNGLVLASGGISYLMAKVTEASVESVSSSLSLSSNLETSLRLYDPGAGGVVAARAQANFASTLELKLSSGKIGKGVPDCIAIEGNVMAMVGLYGDPSRSYALAKKDTDIGAFLARLADNFMIAVKGSVSIVYGLKTVSRQMFPDLKLHVANGYGLLSSGGKHITGVDPGFYLYLEGRSLPSAVLMAVIGTLLPCLDVIIDKIFGKGATAGFIKFATPGSSSSTRLGLAVNTEDSGVYLQVPIAAVLQTSPPFNVIPGIESALGALELELKVRNSDGKVSFKIKYHLSKFLEMVWEELLLVWYEAGKVFAAAERALIDFGSGTMRITNEVIQKTAHNIETGITKAGEGIKNWAKDNVNWCNSLESPYAPQTRLPDSCPAGHDFFAGLCYPACRSGFYGQLTMCIPNCPSGFRNDGLFCFKPAPYGRGFGSPMKTTCKGWKCSSNCGSKERCGALCYSRCRDGYSAFGCNICSPKCPSNTADVGISCAKKTYDRGVGKIPGCRSGETMTAGLCHTPCKDGYEFRAGVCWKKC